MFHFLNLSCFHSFSSHWMPLCKLSFVGLFLLLMFVVVVLDACKVLLLTKLVFGGDDNKEVEASMPAGLVVSYDFGIISRLLTSNGLNKLEDEVTSWPPDGIPTTLIDTDRQGSLISTSSSSNVVSSEAVVVASGTSNGSGGLGNQIFSELEKWKKSQ